MAALGVPTAVPAGFVAAAVVAAGAEVEVAATDGVAGDGDPTGDGEPAGFVAGSGVDVAVEGGGAVAGIVPAISVAASSSLDGVAVAPTPRSAQPVRRTTQKNKAADRQCGAFIRWRRSRFVFAPVNLIATIIDCRPP